MKFSNLSRSYSTIFFISIISFYSCTFNKKPDGFIDYINKDLNYQVNTQNSKFIVLSLYSCNDCIIKTCQLLSDLDKEENYVYLVVAANFTKEINQFFSSIQKNKSIKILYDTNMSIINKDFFIDEKNKFYEYSDGKLTSTFPFEPKNNFDKLKKILI